MKLDAMTASEASARTSIRVALNLPFAADEVADYLFEPNVVGHWLASHAVLRPKLESPAVLPRAAAVGNWGIRVTPVSGRVS